MQNYIYDLCYIPSKDRYIYKIYVGKKHLATVDVKTRKEGDKTIKKAFPNAVLRSIKLNG